MGIVGRVVNAVAYAIVRLGLRFESSVTAMSTIAVRKLMVKIASLFIKFRRNGLIEAYQSAKVPDVVFALLLALVIPSFAAVYTVDYGAQAATAMVATISLVMLVSIFQRGVVSGLAAGIVEE